MRRGNYGLGETLLSAQSSLEKCGQNVDNPLKPWHLRRAATGLLNSLFHHLESPHGFDNPRHGERNLAPAQRMVRDQDVD